MNRVIQGVYAPGSTFKIAAAIAGLEEGLVGPQTTVYCPGYYSIYGTVRRCQAKGGHGLVSLRQAIAKSCNVYFYQLGVRLEISRLALWAGRLGLGSPTGVDLPHEASGLMPSPEWKQRVFKLPWYAGETVSVAIGQGQVTATPLQLARLAALVANGGRLVHPHLVRSVGGAPVPWPAPEPVGLRPETVRLVAEGMREVVAAGTGRRAQVPGVAVAGKTGSAQVVASARLAREPRSPKLMPHGWFVCFAPVERPRIALAVLVEHGGSGGEAAAPVAREILARYFGVSLPEAVPVEAPEVVDEEPEPGP
jgi:penicillin-binding protein 2